MNRRDFLIRSATLIGACLLPMPEVAGTTTPDILEVVATGKLGLTTTPPTAYLELAKHFIYDIQFVPVLPRSPEKCGYIATLCGKLQDKEETDWIAAEYIEESWQFDEIVGTLEDAMRRRYVEIANRDN